MSRKIIFRENVFVFWSSSTTKTFAFFDIYLLHWFKSTGVLYRIGNCKESSKCALNSRFLHIFWYKGFFKIATKIALCASKVVCTCAAHVHTQKRSKSICNLRGEL